MLVKRARLVFSQSCSVFAVEVVSRKLSIIVCDVVFQLGDLAARLHLDRAGQFALRHHAVATSAMARTWFRQVRTQQVTVAGQILQWDRRAPGKFAWPPRRPSTPTSSRPGGDLLGEGGERFVWCQVRFVDRVGERRHLAHRFDGQVLLQIAVGDRLVTN